MPDATPRAIVSSPPPPPPPPREGCARVGSLDALESDPSCVIRQVGDDVMRTSMKTLAIGVVLEPPEVTAGASGSFALSIRNTGPSEVLVVLEARPRPIGPRLDWTRVVGIPGERVPTSDTPRLFFSLTTSDSANHDVDAMPVLSGSTPAPGALTLLGVHLRPGGKLTHTSSWWALRIPAPAPMYQDDAGHRYYPKTAAVPLLPGEYTATMEVPLYGVTREERRFGARVKVVPAPLKDGGVRH